MKKLSVAAFLLISTLAFSQQNTHIVAKGDNPYNIAKKYGMSLEELLRLNPSIKDGKVAIGDKINIKAGKNAPPVKKTPKAETLGQIIIQPKQTIYGVTRQYNITEEQLRIWNPNLGTGFQIGERINLPLSKIQQYGGVLAPKDTTPKENTSTAPVVEQPARPADTNAYSNTGTSSDNYLTYTVAPGDTTFGIINKFGVTLEQISALNPALSSGLQPGMVLKLKKLEAAYVKKDNGALNVVLMLPFGYDSGDSKYRSLSLDFLSGAKLAVERNVAQGKKINVRVVDAGSEQTFKNSLTQINKDNTDLIIGPFFKSNVMDVLDYVRAQRIPVVSPFANAEELQNYDNLVIIETSEKVFANRIADEVKSAYANQKIYILSDPSGANATLVQNEIKSKIKNADIVVVRNASDIQADTNITTGQKAPVIAVMADDDETALQNFANRMISLSREVSGNRGFSMHYSTYFNKKMDDLSQVSFVFLVDRTINDEGDFEKEVLGDFKEKYCKMPGKYAVIGFDVVNDMLSRENSQGELFKQMSRSQTQLASKFEFVRAKPNGAYVNTGYRVVRYLP